MKGEKIEVFVETMPTGGTITYIPSTQEGLTLRVYQSLDGSIVQTKHASTAFLKEKV